MALKRGKTLFQLTWKNDSYSFLLLAFLETTFVSIVTGFDFDPSLNTNGSILADVEEVLQNFICEGTVEVTGCIVIVNGFTNGSTVINAQVQISADESAPIDIAAKVKAVVDSGTGIEALGNETATGQKTVGKSKVSYLNIGYQSSS